MLRAIAVSILALLAIPASSRAQTIDPDVIFRVFLLDGRALPSYGEYAVVADRVVFVLPVGDPQRKVDLQLMSLPMSTIDMVRTSRYAESTRARRYAVTRGPAEYTEITTSVNVALDELENEPDAKKRLAIAEDARGKLLAWPAAHYGYRASEVRELAGLFDDVITELKVAAGETRFSLALMVGPPDPQYERPLPALSLRESIALALAAASVSDVSTDRASLLESALARSGDDPADSDLRAEATRRLEAERTADAAYAQLASELTARADVAMRRGDVVGVVAVRSELLDRDRALGALRPVEARKLRDRLDDMIERTQIYRLVLDHWASVRRSLLQYERDIRPVLSNLDGLTNVLTNIRDMSGPDFSRLVQATARVKHLTDQVQLVVPPPDLQAVHSALVSALFMARQACERRAQAIAAPNISVARDAAAAAAGTLLLVAQVRQDLVSQLFRPRFQ